MCDYCFVLGTSTDTLSHYDTIEGIVFYVGPRTPHRVSMHTGLLAQITGCIDNLERIRRLQPTDKHRELP